MISVIVPCYNAGQYIERCLLSIINQTYRDLEIIVIDDGSVDNSRDIINRLSKIDDRIKYYYHPNRGVSYSRNRGIEISTGELITFVDGDDAIESTMYQTLVDLLIEYNADISQCSYMRNVDGEIKYIGNTGKTFIFAKDEIAKSLLESTLIAPSVCNKLFKKEVIGKIRFNEDYKINEDYLFDFMTFQCARKSVYIDLCFYTYYTSDTSSCAHTPNIKKAEDCHNVSKTILENSIGKPYEKLAERRYNNSFFDLYRSYRYSFILDDRKKAKKIRKQIASLYRAKQFDANAQKKAFLIIYLPFAYKPIYNLYNLIRKPNWDL